MEYDLFIKIIIVKSYIFFLQKNSSTQLHFYGLFETLALKDD